MKGFNDYKKNKTSKGKTASKMIETNEETYMKTNEDDKAFIGFEDADPAYPDVSYPEGGGKTAGVGKINDDLLKGNKKPMTRAEKRLKMRLNKAEERAKKREIAQAKKEERKMSRGEKPSFLMNLAKFQDDMKAKIEYKKEHKDEIKGAKKEKKDKRRDERLIIKQNKKEEKEQIALDKKAENQAKKIEKRAKAASINAEKKELKQLKRTDKEAYKAKVASIKAEKKEKKQRLKEEKQRLMQEMRDKGIKVGYSKGMVAAVIVLAICLGVATAGVGVLSGTTASYMIKAENAYNKAYYQLIMDMNNLETSMTKVMAENSSLAKGTTLNEVSALALSAENNLTSLPTENQNEVQTISQFFNKVMDYAKYLANKLYGGGQLTSEEESNLATFISINTKLKEALNKTFEETVMKGEKIFTKGKFLMGQYIDPLIDAYNIVSEGSIEYPTLIYDGPFSDAKVEADSNLRGNSDGVSEQEARNTAGMLMNKMTEMNYGGETKNSNLVCYSFIGKNEMSEISVQIEKQSGMVILVDCFRKVTANEISGDEAIKFAQSYLTKLGYQNVVPVWKNISDNLMTINFAEKCNDALCYSRLVKVIVALDNGEILGLEGATYIANHNKTISTTTKISMSEAKDKVSKDLYITSSRLAVIPKNKSEIVVYEFAGNMNGMTFYVYIDGNTGKEVNVLRVIQNDEQGQLVL